MIFLFPSRPRFPLRTASRIASALLLVLLLAPSSLPWNAANASKEEGPIRVRGLSAPAGDVSYFAELDRTPGLVYHKNGHAYIIEHAIRLLREDGCPNWGDFAQSYLLHLASGAVHADAYKGRVEIRIELELLWGLITAHDWKWDLTCAGGCEHYHNISDGSGLDLTGFSILSKAADYLIKILTIYASWYTSAMGLVNLDIEVIPDIDHRYPSGADLSAEHYLNAVETWHNGKVSYPARSQRESAMYELGWACHFLADLTVAQHLYEMFIGGHSDYENFADGKGDEFWLHAAKGDFAKHFSGAIPPPRELADSLARTLRVQHPENIDLAEHGGDADRLQALRVALPLAERYTAALLARFMTEIGVPKTAPPLRGYVSVKGSADKVPGAYVYYAPFNPIEQNVDLMGQWRGWSHVRADAQGMYSIPVTGAMKYLIRPAMPGYSFDGTTDANLEFGPKTCPVEYRQAPGATDTDTDMLNLYMDRLPQPMPVKAYVQLPGQKQAALALEHPAGLLTRSRADIVKAESRLARSGTAVSPALAEVLTTSVLDVDVTTNVVGVQANDINLPVEAVLNIQVSNYLDYTTGKVVTSDVVLREAVDGFRAKWKAAGLPMDASGALKTSLSGNELLKPFDAVGAAGLQALKTKLHTRQEPSPSAAGGAPRTVYSFVPPYADDGRASILMENGLALVPAPRGVEIEVSTVPAPGCLLAPTIVRLTTNAEGRASCRLKAGSHAGKVRLQVKVTRNPAAPQILPSETIEIAVQPRLRGVDPGREFEVRLEPVILMKALQATVLTPRPAAATATKPGAFRTTIQVSPQGITHRGVDLSASFRPAMRDATLPAPPPPVEKTRPSLADKPQPAAAQPAVPDISGTWKSSIGLVYEITQTGDTFTWHVASLNQRAEGTISGDSVRASWRGLIGRDTATGKITLDAAGRAVRIEWSNKVVFFR